MPSHVAPHRFGSLSFSSPFPMKEQALHGAVGRGDVTAVSKLLQRGHNINCKNSQGETPLHQAIEHRNTTLVRLLLKQGADPSRTPNYGVSTLCQAVESVNLEIVELIIQTKIDFSSELRLNTKQNPLLLAIVHESVDITRLLLRHGACVDVTNERGETPLVLVGMGTDPDKQLQLAILLMAHGADPTEKDSHGHEAIHYSWPNVFTAFMREYTCQSTVLSLRSLSRKTTLDHLVLHSGQSSMDDSVYPLPLPPPLKEFLLFNNQS